MDHVAGTGFAFGADHGSAFSDAPQGFTYVARAADKRRLECMLIHVVGFVSWGKNFGFVDVVHAKSLKNLCFRKMADPALGHYRDRDRFHDLANLLGRRHARYATLSANLRGHAL